jgi:thiol:disulfide interchange protein
MAYQRIYALGLMFAASAVSAGDLLHAQGKADALLPVDQAFVMQGAVHSGHEIVLDWTIAPGYYLYRKSLKITVDAPANAPFAGPVLPTGQTMNDAEFGNVEVYRGAVQARLSLPADAIAPRTLRVRYQGCADIGVCYPPQTRLVAVK